MSNTESSPATSKPGSGSGERKKATPPDLPDITRRAETALQQRWPDVSLGELKTLPGGTSSLTYIVSTNLASDPYVVVKVAPPGLDPVRNRDVLRQARAIEAIGRIPGVKVPAIYARDAGAPPEVPPLFVMSFVEGQSHEPYTLADDHPTQEELAARIRTAVSMLAAMQATDPASIGLGDEPATSLPDELGRWRTAFGSCELPPETAQLEQSVFEKLTASMPAPMPPAILHGDWRLGNMQCVGSDVGAVIDWEIWSVGDPRVDLGWLTLMMSPDRPESPAPPYPVPSVAEILAMYESARGITVRDMGWFHALVRYKQSAASALLVKNAHRRGESGPHIDHMDEMIGKLLAWALTAL